MNKEQKGVDKAVIIVVLLIVVCVAGYAIWQQFGKEKDKDDSLKVDNQIELTAENLSLTTWSRDEEQARYELDFLDGNGLQFCRFEGEVNTPPLSTVNGSYSISKNNVIAVIYKIDEQEYSEQYKVVLSSDKLILSPANDNSSRLAGTYLPDEETEEEATENASSDKESDNAETVSPVSTDQNGESIPEQTPSEENTEALTTEPETIKVTEPVVDDAWKTTYIEYISMQTDTDWMYRLIYLNDDNIPELYMQGGYLALGGRICTYNAGYISPIQIGAYGFSYIERSGLIMDSGGRMGDYYDQIFALENNDLVLKFDGSYGVDDNTLYFDESDYKYRYNNTVVSKSEYDITKNKLFDTSSAVHCEAKYNKQQIISQINSMT